MAPSSRKWDYEESSVEYESETSVINYTRDSKSYEDQEYPFHIYMWLILYAVNNYMSIINTAAGSKHKIKHERNNMLLITEKMS